MGADSYENIWGQLYLQRTKKEVKNKKLEKFDDLPNLFLLHANVNRTIFLL